MRFTQKMGAGLLAAVMAVGVLTAGAAAETIPMEIEAEQYAIDIIQPLIQGDLKFYDAVIPRNGVLETDGTLYCLFCATDLFDTDSNLKRDTVTEIVIPSEVNGKRVSQIGYNAFWCCKNLKTVYIPKAVTQINFTAFAGCDNLTDIYYTGSEADWDNIFWPVDGPITVGVDYFIHNATVHFNSNPGEEANAAKPAKVSSIKKSASKSTIKLTWNKSEDADSYVVKYSTDKKTWKTKTVKTNSITLKKMKSGKKYYFKVAAQKDGVTGEFSKAFGVTTKK